MSGSSPVSVALLQQQATAAFAAYAAAGTLTDATYSQLGGMLALFQTALATAQALQTLASNAFDANNDDALFASGVDPTAMTASLFLLQDISQAMVDINNVANRLARGIAIIQLAQQGGAS